MIKAVLFDMDGVLLDSEHYITRAGMMMFEEKGFKVNYDDFKEFTGMGETRFLGGVAEKHGIPFDVEEDKTRAYEIYREIVKGQLEAFPGVFEFIDKCKRKGLRTAVATSADKVKMLINLEGIGLEKSKFDAIITGEEVENKKPDPEIFIEVSKKMDLLPEECLVVEDAVSGVKAAKAAGCKCLALTTSFSPDELKEADWITRDLSTAEDDCISW